MVFWEKLGIFYLLRIWFILNGLDKASDYLSIYHINTWEYLKDALERINDHKMNRLEELLPDNWQRSRNDAAKK